MSVWTLPRRTVVRAWRIAGFVLYFGYEFLKSNAEVVWEIVTPGSRAAPAVVALPLRSRTRLEIVSMANLITLTPGTLTLEVALDPPTLYVHGMFAPDPRSFQAQLRELEDRLLTALRPVGGTAGTGGAAGSGGSAGSGGERR